MLSRVLSGHIIIYVTYSVLTFSLYHPPSTLDEMVSHSVTFSSADDVLDVHVKLQYPGSSGDGYLLDATMLETIHGAYLLLFSYVM